VLKVCKAHREILVAKEQLERMEHKALKEM
jgi:hypothetical protein